jgi:anti-anti-sigma regulatory factor
MMVRITTMAEDAQNVRLKVEGRVVGEWVSELDNSCTGFLAQNKMIVLDLSEVSFIDRQGINVLKQVPADKVHIQGGEFVGAGLVRTVSRYSEGLMR